MTETSPTDPKDKPCEACNGTGRIAVPTVYAGTPDSETVPCEECGGTGRLRVGLELGRKVRLLCDAAGVPAGTVGEVIGFYRGEAQACVVSFSVGERVVANSELESAAEDLRFRDD